MLKLELTTNSMRALELKIPPLAIALFMVVAMRGISLAAPEFGFAFAGREWIAVIFSILGGVISISGIVSFQLAGTTINPVNPDAATSLVSSGIYRLTRNPMYLGVLFLLIGWAVYLANPLTLMGTVVFVLYMNRFQIAPEERVLAAKFGEAFTAYNARVRRWL
jgi:protein-S-isoprenylcysteine O-methyltransferase Ste14